MQDYFRRAGQQVTLDPDGVSGRPFRVAPAALSGSPRPPFPVAPAALSV